MSGSNGCLYWWGSGGMWALALSGRHCLQGTRMTMMIADEPTLDDACVSWLRQITYVPHCSGSRGFMTDFRGGLSVPPLLSQPSGKYKLETRIWSHRSISRPDDIVDRVGRRDDIIS
jgi:hypothetical protein